MTPIPDFEDLNEYVRTTGFPLPPAYAKQW